MRTAVYRAFEIEEPVAKGQMTPYARPAFWSDLLRDLAVRLAGLDGLVLPVKFATANDAKLCHLAYANRRKRSGRYAPIDERLRCSQRGDRVFFWLESKEEAHDA